MRFSLSFRRPKLRLKGLCSTWLHSRLEEPVDARRDIWTGTENEMDHCFSILWNWNMFFWNLFFGAFDPINLGSSCPLSRCLSPLWPNRPAFPSRLLRAFLEARHWHPSPEGYHSECWSNQKHAQKLAGTWFLAQTVTSPPVSMFKTQEKKTSQVHHFRHPKTSKNHISQDRRSTPCPSPGLRESYHPHFWSSQISPLHSPRSETPHPGASLGD